MFRTPAARRRARHLLVTASAAALALQLAPPAPAAADPGTVPRTTAEFAAELAHAGDEYFDALVVFRDRQSFALLSGLDRPVHYYEHFPVARVLLDAREIAGLLDEDQVRFVEPNHHDHQMLNEEARALTRVTDVQQVTGTAVTGATGKDVHVAVIDLGIDAGHPDLAPAVEESWVPVGTSGTVFAPVPPAGMLVYDGRPLPVGDHHTYVSGKPDGIDVAGGYRVAPALNTDLHGHGTHVSGTIAGQGDAQGRDRGVAPGVRLHAYQFGPSPTTGAPLSYLLDAYDHLLRDPRIRLVNASLGGGACKATDDTWPFRAVLQAMRAAYEKGVLTVLSYGNSGTSPDGSCTATLQSVQPYALAVGATTKGGRPWTASSRGPVGQNQDRALALRNLKRYLDSGATTWPVGEAPIGLFRPGLTAPGAAIVSTVSANHLLPQHGADPFRRPGYAQMSGTSMSAPHVTGIAALVVEEYRKRHGVDPSPLTLIGILEGSADPSRFGAEDTIAVGAGMADAAAAVARARATAVPVQAAELPSTAAPQISATSTVSGVVPAGSYLSDVGYQTLAVQVPEGTRRLVVQPTLTGAPNIGYSLFPPGTSEEGVRTGRPVSSNVDQLAQPTLYAVEAADPAPGTWLLRVDGARVGGPYQAKVNLLTLTGS